MKIIITMAGQGSRFREAGFDEPKHMITVKGKSLFEWSLLSLNSFFDKQFIFVMRASEKSPAFVLEKCSILGISKFCCVELESLTAGQAATVLEAKQAIADLAEPILIYNIDTHIRPGQIGPNDIQGDGFLPAFSAPGEHWSFVKFDSAFRVTEVAEKKRISEFATVGLYYFGSFKLFEECFKRCSYQGYREKYVAPLYAELISDPTKLVFTKILPSQVVVPLGTPAEVKAFAEEQITTQPQLS